MSYFSSKIELFFFTRNFSNSLEFITIGSAKRDTKQQNEEKERLAHNRRVKFVESICFSGRPDDDKDPLPHWLIYIGYLLCAGAIFACGFFVILYGFQFGALKSNQWIVSMIISLLLIILILEPLKVSEKFLI